jgi:hypothetical protein
LQIHKAKFGPPKKGRKKPFTNVHLEEEEEEEVEKESRVLYGCVGWSDRDSMA